MSCKVKCGYSAKNSVTEQHSLGQLLQRFYGELRRVARARLRRLPPCRTVHTTELIHEAYLRLRKKSIRYWQDRRMFFGDMARAMRDIVAEHARRKQALKHGGGLVRVDLAAPLPGRGLAGSLSAEEVLTLMTALEKMAQDHPQHADIVFLRYFGGLTMSEISEVSSASLRTVERKWKFARAWLYEQLSSN